METSRRASAGDLPQSCNNQHIQIERLKDDNASAQKQSTGCFGCLSKRNVPKCEVKDGALNNSKQKGKVELECCRGNSDVPSSGNDFSGTKILPSNIINNLNNLDLSISLDKETPILNNMVEDFGAETSKQHRTRLDNNHSQLPNKMPLLAIAGHKSDCTENSLLFPLDSSLKHDNLLKTDITDRLTTDSGIDLISSPHTQVENIYDSVQHFNSKRLNFLKEDSSRKVEELENVEFHHKIGMDLMLEIDSENFDAIHFESYRTAQKLNYIRQKLKLHHIDIYQVVDSFREFNNKKMMNINDLYELSGKLYSSHHPQHQLQPQSLMSSTLTSESQSKASTLMVAWLLHIYDLKRVGSVDNFSVKVALSSICVGPLFEKLRYIFKDMHSDDGALTKENLQVYLQSVLALPLSLSRRHSSNAALMANMEGNIDKFLDEMIRGEVPSYLGWLQVLHNLIRAEQAIHKVECTSCHATNFTGFLYKCLECQNYFMCQSCFWRGFTSEDHTVQHKVKEFITTKPPSDEPGKLQGNTLESALIKGSNNHHGKIVTDLPGSPLSSLNGFFQPWSSANCTLTSAGKKISMISVEESLSASRMRRVIPQTSEDDEHKLILRYVHRLKSCPQKMEPLDQVTERQNLVFELEAKNREIQKEIQRLKYQQMQQRDRRSATLTSESDASDVDQLDQNLLKEIRFLRQHQGDLEARIKGLQGSRRGLMQQLEGLMRKLKTQSSLSPSICSPRSYCDSPSFTYPSSHHSLPLPHHAIPPLSSHVHQSQPPFQSQPVQQALSQPHPPSSYASQSPRFPHQPFQTPKAHILSQSSPKSPGLNPVNYSMGSEFHQAFAFPSPSNVQGLQNVGLRQDLLMATDEVTDAVSSLVLELNTGESSDSDQERTRNVVAAALNSPGKKHSEADFGVMHVRSTPIINPRSLGKTEESEDLRRVGSLRENEMHRPGKGIEKEANKGRRGITSQISESNPGLEMDGKKFHSKSLEMDEDELRKNWEGPKRRWSNR